jgi:flagellar basal body-associated protein FliL
MADKDKGSDKEERAEGEAKAAGSSKMKNMLLLGAGAALLIGVSVGTTMLLSGGGSHGDTEEATADESADTDTKKTDKKGKKEKKGKKDKEKGKKDEPVLTTYLPLDPPFVVNFESTQETRFLQVSMEVMAHDPQAIEDAKKHMPAIRNSLVLLLSSQNQKTLITLEGKEKVRAEALAAIQKILQEQTGKPGVEAVYFTGFVMQ